MKHIPIASSAIPIYLPSPEAQILRRFCLSRPRPRASRPARVRGDAGARPGWTHSSKEPHAKYINLQGKNDLGGRLIVKAIFENNVLRPLDKLDLLEGEVVEIELKKWSIFGLLNGWKIDTQSLKDELKRDR
jgi:predicted DNA-binding antitoxin AbrB/MazE fold protein